MRTIVLCTLMAALLIMTAACSSDSQAETSVGAPADKAEETAESAADTASAETTGPFQDFTATGIMGEEFTQDVFADRDISIVNIMATWCGPCVSEMPELESLYRNSDIGVVGIVIDTSTQGEINQTALDNAQVIADRLGITYPMLIPDGTDFSGITRTTQVVPTSYLVDSTGRVVAGPVEGARSEQDWLELTTNVLEAIK